MQSETPHSDPTQHKFVLLVIAVTVIAVMILAVVIALLFFRGSPSTGNSTSTTSSKSSAQSRVTSTVAETYPNWEFGDTWRAMSPAPNCAEPFTIQTPVNINLVESILYPGQVRGTDYKSHGGFRFPSTTNAVTVTAPFDAYLVKASRYIESGETQYFFVFISSCGMMYRFDHLLTLTPKFQAIADTLPAAQPNDSRTQNINPPVLIKAGEQVATEIGFKQTKNVAVDFGMNDLRQPNEISQNPTWAAAHPQKEFLHYGVCWLDYLPEPAKTTAYSLPAGDGVMGKTSDYCK